MDDEEKKVNNKLSKLNKENKENNNIEIKELRLGKLSPCFNLVCLKARHRLIDLEKKFTKSEYRDYIRKCKNMYSISSDMNNKYTISDLYSKEKYDINNILSVFHKIDSKLDSQKIKVVKIKKKKILNFVDNKSISCTNFYKNKSNIKNNNIFYDYKNTMHRDIHTHEESKSNKKKNSISYETINSANNRMNKTTYRLIKKIKNKTSAKDKITSKNKIILKNVSKSNEFSKTPLNFGFKKIKNINDPISDKNNKNRLKSSSLIFKIYPKELALSSRRSGFTFTQYGGIIHNNSMFRNKNIVYLLPKNYNLPLLYKNAKV
jgi:hypothetical protein